MVGMPIENYALWFDESTSQCTMSLPIRLLLLDKATRAPASKPPGPQKVLGFSFFRVSQPVRAELLLCKY
ncbi:hypothetical protein ACVILK_003323 [Bradyrhizobium embrapense]